MTRIKVFDPSNANIIYTNIRETLNNYKWRENQIPSALLSEVM